MGFPPESCIVAVCECSTGAKDVDIERCTTWLLGDQRVTKKVADLDITDDLKRIADCEARGVGTDALKDAVLAQNGDVNAACSIFA